MVTRKLARSLLLLGLLFPVLIGVTTVTASPGNCSLATLKGKYGSLEQGTVVVDLGAPFPPPPWPVALTAIDTYDGKGNLSGTYWANFGGIPVSGPFTGTYIVNPDCTYSDTITPEGESPSHRVGTITGEGIDQELQTIYTDAWLVAFGTAKKTLPWGCSLRTLKGTYEVFGQGTDTGIAVSWFSFCPFRLPTLGFSLPTAQGIFPVKTLKVWTAWLYRPRLKLRIP